MAVVFFADSFEGRCDDRFWPAANLLIKRLFRSESGESFLAQKKCIINSASVGGRAEEISLATILKFQKSRILVACREVLNEIVAIVFRAVDRKQCAGYEVFSEEVVESEYETATIRCREAKLDKVSRVRLRALERKHGRPLIW